MNRACGSRGTDSPRGDSPLGSRPGFPCLFDSRRPEVRRRPPGLSFPQGKPYPAPSESLTARQLWPVAPSAILESAQGIHCGHRRATPIPSSPRRPRLPSSIEERSHDGAHHEVRAGRPPGSNYRPRPSRRARKRWRDTAAPVGCVAAPGQSRDHPHRTPPADRARQEEDRARKRWPKPYVPTCGRPKT
jgi:hypothetical protein